MLYVTYHGDSHSDKSANVFNNVYAYDFKGNQLSDSVLQVQPGTLAELRGIYFVQGYLYVVNGSGSTSNVLCFSGSGTTYTQEPGIFIANTTVNAIQHPFALAFTDETCFVSNQDTNVVALLHMISPTQATAVNGAAAPYLTKQYATGTFLNGTFVASSDGSLHTPPTTPVPDDLGGLCVSFANGKVHHSVRDIVLAGPGTPPNPLLLYVADEPGKRIRLYDPICGTPCGVSNEIPLPTHLFAHNGTLYVSASDQLLSAPLVSTPGTSPTDQCLDLQSIPLTLPPEVDTTKLAFAGMTIDDCGNFYVALRTNNMIVQYAGGDFSKPSLWLACHKHASPEFIVYVADQHL